MKESLPLYAAFSALELAREYRDKALMDRDYFLNRYAQDMGLEHIYAEVKKRLG